MDKFVKELLTEDVLVETAKRYGIGKEKVYFVGGFENFIFGFEANDKSFIVRISHSSHRDLDDIKSELDFVFYLAKNGARVSMSVATVSGNLVEKIDASDGSYFSISAFTKAEGRPPKSQDLNEEFLYSYGKTIGQFHKFTKNYVPSEGIKKRFAWYQDPLLMNAKTYLKDEDLVILDRLNELMESIKSTPITTPKNLPNNRRQVFFDVLSIHWKTFFLFGLLFLLLCLPMNVVSVLKTLFLNNLYAEAGNLGDEEKRQLVSTIMSLNITAAVLQISCILFLAAGIAGFVKVIRQYSWLENVYFKTDFFSGIKENGGQMLLLGLLVSVVYVLCVYAFNFAQVVNNPLLSVLALVPIGFSIFLGIPITAYAVVCISIYKNTFKQILLTALACFINKPLRTLGFLVGCLAAFAVQLIPNFLVLIISKILLTFIIPIIFLAWYLFALDRLDQVVNKENYPSLVGKGTFPEQMKRAKA